MTSWPTTLLQRLEALDVSEAPHGLYGIRWAYSSGDHFPQLAHVLASNKRAGFFPKHYGTSGSQNQNYDSVVFCDPSNAVVVSLTMEDLATTKVRKFGSSYRVDLKHRKESECQVDVRRLVRRSVRHSMSDGIHSVGALLLIAHTTDENELTSLLGDYGESDFLKRYGMQRHTLEWKDRFGRGFLTTLNLWVPIQYA